VLGLTILVVADIVLALADNPWVTFAGAAFWGLHMAFTQGLLSKLVADTAPANLRGTAFGVFNLVSGLALFLASFIATAVLLVTRMRQQYQLLDRARQTADEETQKAVDTIMGPLKEAQDLVSALAGEVSSGALDDAALESRLREMVKKDPDIMEACVAYRPFGHTPGERLYAPCAELDEGKISFFDLGDEYDYTGEEWYNEVISSGRPAWSEPYRDKRTNEMAISCNVPFFLKPDGEKVSGVVHLAFSLATIREYSHSLELGHSYLRFIVTRRGAFIYFPLNEVVESQKSIFAMQKTDEERRIEEKIRQALRGKRTLYESRDSSNNFSYIVAFEPVPVTGWCLGSHYLKEQFTLSNTDFRRQQMAIIIAGILCLTSLMALISGAWKLEKRSLWATSIVFSLLCTAGTFDIWHIVYTAPLQKNGNSIFITDRVMLHKALAEYEAPRKKAGETAPIYIPTGIYIETLEFKASNELKAAGYIWQKYALSIDPDISREVIFPEAISFSLKEVYRITIDTFEVIRWRFEATLREHFDYSKYPFDRPDIWIWLRHADLDNMVTLVPDLNSYKVMSPLTCPGLPSSGLVLPGYTVQGSFFDYRKYIATTDFGVNDPTSFETSPELFFHIAARRNILNPFVSKIFPLLIMLSMLFVVKMKFSNNEEEKQTFGLSGLGVLGTVISFFFTTMVSQSALRTEMNVEGVTFLENFHLITYIMLFLMAVTTFFFIGSRKPSILEYEDCLLSKLLYWPIVSSLVLIVTIVYYY